MKGRLSSTAFWAGILGGIKLITESFGLQIITDDQVNDIANGLAAIFVVIGVSASYKNF